MAILVSADGNIFSGKCPSHHSLSVKVRVKVEVSRPYLSFYERGGWVVSQ